MYSQRNLVRETDEHVHADTIASEHHSKVRSYTPQIYL